MICQRSGCHAVTTVTTRPAVRSDNVTRRKWSALRLTAAALAWLRLEGKRREGQSLKVCDLPHHGDREVAMVTRLTASIIISSPPPPIYSCLILPLLQPFPLRSPHLAASPFPLLSCQLPWRQCCHGDRAAGQIS